MRIEVKIFFTGCYYVMSRCFPYDGRRLTDTWCLSETKRGTKYFLSVFAKYTRSLQNIKQQFRPPYGNVGVFFCAFHWVEIEKAVHSEQFENIHCRKRIHGKFCLDLYEKLLWMLFLPFKFNSKELMLWKLLLHFWFCFRLVLFRLVSHVVCLL